MRPPRPPRDRLDTTRPDGPLLAGQTSRHGSVRATIAVAAGLHLVLAALAYPGIAASLLAALGIGVLAMTGLRRVCDWLGQRTSSSVPQRLDCATDP